jgi:hypothetical protein
MDSRLNNTIFKTINFIRDQCELSVEDLVVINDTALILGGFKRCASASVELAISEKQLQTIDDMVAGVWFDYCTVDGRKNKAYDVTYTPVIFTSISDVSVLETTNKENYRCATFECALDNLLLINRYDVQNDYWVEVLLHFRDFIRKLKLPDMMVTKEHLDFVRSCMNFDHYYYYSDDGSVYRAGVEREKEIGRKIIADHIYKLIYNEYFKKPMRATA